MSKKWTPEEDILLATLYEDHQKQYLINTLNKPWKAIIRRAHRLGLKRNDLVINADKKIKGPRSDRWLDEEDTLLKEIFPNETKENIIIHFERSWKSICNRAKKLKLYRNEIIRKNERIEASRKSPSLMSSWTPEEDILLKELYYSTPKKDILKKINHTWRSIRHHALQLKIKRSPSIIKSDNVEGTKKAMMDKYGVEYSTLLPSMKEKTKKTNMERRGVEYPSESKQVIEKVRKTVKEKYGVDSVFQSFEVKEKIKKTNMEKYGVKNPQQNKKIKEKTEKTNVEKYGVKNPFQLVDKVKEGMIKKYDERIPLKVPHIALKKKETCILKYGHEYPTQNEEVKENLKRVLNSAEVKEKKQVSLREKGKMPYSLEEQDFLNYLTIIDPDIVWHPLHPILKHTIDFYSPRYDLWIQYDGVYWHGKNNSKVSKFQSDAIEKIKKKDLIENQTITNLVRFWSDDFLNAKKNNTVIAFISNKLKDKVEKVVACHQYIKKIENYSEDIKNLPFDIENLSAKNFILNKEPLSIEIKEFIEKYEWLGTVGITPKWCFTARYKEVLGGVVLINEPTAYSTILGKDTPIYEALIQRGASASWTPKNLGSRLIMYACNWMVTNTSKRAFVGYADPSANERGIIYQACNFDYLGNNFGEKYLYQNKNDNTIISIHSLKRTSSFIKWCRESNIEINKDWFKENGFKDINKIPEDIKIRWLDSIRQAISTSKKIAKLKKGKFILVLPKDRKEKKLFKTLKTYTPLPYKKEFNNPEAITLERKNFNNHGKTADRKNSSKIQFIIDNHEKLSRSEIAKELNETLRWVKRQIASLIKENKILSKKPLKPIPL